MAIIKAVLFHLNGTLLDREASLQQFIAGQFYLILNKFVASYLVKN